jgi:hypothetical protein
MADQEAQIRKLKHGLENWKEIALQGKKVFIWERQWHPTALVGGSTVLFMFLWLLDPSILTVVSVFGLCVTVSDYVIPSVASSFFKPEKWTARREKEFEELCTNIVLYKARLELTWSRYYKLKTTNRKLVRLLFCICCVLIFVVLVFYLDDLRFERVGLDRVHLQQFVLGLRFGNFFGVAAGNGAQRNNQQMQRVRAQLPGGVFETSQVKS